MNSCQSFKPRGRVGLRCKRHAAAKKQSGGPREVSDTTNLDLLVGPRRSRPVKCHEVFGLRFEATLQERRRLPLDMISIAIREQTVAESRTVGINRPLERHNGGGGGCVRTPCRKTGEDRSPPGVTDGHCTLGRSAMPLGSDPVTPSIRDGSAFGRRYQWRGGTNRPGVTSTAIGLAPSPYGYRSNSAAVCVISEDPSLRLQMTDDVTDLSV